MQKYFCEESDFYVRILCICIDLNVAVFIQPNDIQSIPPTELATERLWQEWTNHSLL